MVWQLNTVGGNSENQSMNSSKSSNIAFRNNHETQEVTDLDNSFVLDPRKMQDFPEDEFEVTT